ncbi:MAG TPA: hypothetical protein VL501_08365 [Pyrinomonadaceae bacterium]|nr:hypothetical protein [Pyrinomonadaceae bacterium]
MFTKTLALLFVGACITTASFAQKGIDTQTDKIKTEGNRELSRQNDVYRTWSWGKDKTKTRPPLANPYQLNGRRDALMTTIIDVLRDQKIVVDEASSRTKDGIIITQPFVFAKGAVVTPTELNRYGLIDWTDSAWNRAQYTLTIEVESIDGAHNNIHVTAKVEGRAGNGLTSEWRSVPSSGLAEDNFLAKLVEAVTGVSPDAGLSEH